MTHDDWTKKVQEWNNIAFNVPESTYNSRGEKLNAEILEVSTQLRRVDIRNLDNELNGELGEEMDACIKDNTPWSLRLTELLYEALPTDCMKALIKFNETHKKFADKRNSSVYLTANRMHEDLNNLDFDQLNEQESKALFEILNCCETLLLISDMQFTQEQKATTQEILDLLQEPLKVLQNSQDKKMIKASSSVAKFIAAITDFFTKLFGLSIPDKNKETLKSIEKNAQTFKDQYGVLLNYKQTVTDNKPIKR
jgi:hypothetical protein